jgi:hypothetical protein
VAKSLGFWSKQNQNARRDFQRSNFDLLHPTFGTVVFWGIPYAFAIGPDTHAINRDGSAGRSFRDRVGEQSLPPDCRKEFRNPKQFTPS